MSTSETTTFEVGVCPCGNGRIVKHITTQDNPWSSADIAYEIQCPKCSSEWRLEHRQLILRASEAPYKNARVKEHSEYEKLRVLVDGLVNGYFASFSAPSKKAELAEMQRLGISNHSYNSFLKEKRAGKPPAQLCFGLRNLPWLRRLDEQHGSKKQLSEMLAAWESAKKEGESAYGNIVRQPIA